MISLYADALSSVALSSVCYHLSLCLNIIQAIHYCIQDHFLLVKDIGFIDSQYSEPETIQSFISARILPKPVSCFMQRTINLNYQLMLVTAKINDIIVYRNLPPDLLAV